MTKAEGEVSSPVVVLAGRRIDPESAHERRFSAQDVDAVSERVERTLRDVRPAALVCSAACGADLLALDAAEELDIPRHIVLPTPKEKFLESSVLDRQGMGRDWKKLFDRVVGQAEAEGKLHIVDCGEGEEGYREANRAILREGKQIADGRSLEAWIVWNGQPRGDTDITLHFADEAWRKGLFVRSVSTLPSTEPALPFKDATTCFVIMPFSDKLVDGRLVPFDALFETILAPAISAVQLPEGETLRPYRTDKEFAPGLIDQDMFERLEYSRFALGDLTGLNPNVMFELGQRFSARPAGTILIRQPGTKLPFDISSVKVFEYDTMEPSSSRRTITRVLSEATIQNRIDSPIRRALSERGDGDASRHETTSLDTVLREAELALSRRDLATATVKYAEATRMAPADPVVRLRLAMLEKQRQQPDWSKVLTEAKRATELLPDYAEAWRERGVAEGQIWRSAADKTGLPDGIKSLERAIELAPRDFDAFASLGGILRRKGKPAEALDAYRSSLSVSEGHPYPLLNVIKLEAGLEGAADLSRYEAALDVAARMREGQADVGDPYDAPWCFFDLAEIRLYQGRAEDAVTVLRGGRIHYGPERLRSFRDLLAYLQNTEIVLDGLDRLIECADELLALAPGGQATGLIAPRSRV